MEKYLIIYTYIMILTYDIWLDIINRNKIIKNMFRKQKGGCDETG